MIFNRMIKSHLRYEPNVLNVLFEPTDDYLLYNYNKKAERNTKSSGWKIVKIKTSSIPYGYVSSFTVCVDKLMTSGHQTELEIGIC